MTNKGYQINEKDIDAVIRYLKTIDPENATPEMAISILEHLKSTYHTMAHNDPEKLEKTYQDLVSGTHKFAQCIALNEVFTRSKSQLVTLPGIEPGFAP